MRRSGPAAGRSLHSGGRSTWGDEQRVLRGRRGRWMQAEAEDGVWEVAPLADGRTLAHMYGADAGPVRAEVAVEAAPEGAAQPAQREDGSLADEIVTGDDLRPLHAAAADPGRATLLTLPDVCSQVGALCAGMHRCVGSLKLPEETPAQPPPCCSAMGLGFVCQWSPMHVPLRSTRCMVVRMLQRWSGNHAGPDTAAYFG